MDGRYSPTTDFVYTNLSTIINDYIQTQVHTYTRIHKHEGVGVHTSLRHMRALRAPLSLNDPVNWLNSSFRNTWAMAAAAEAAAAADKQKKTRASVCCRCAGMLQAEQKRFKEIWHGTIYIQ